MFTPLCSQPHGLQTGDVVKLEGVGGMASLCEEGRVFTVKVTGRHTLSLGDTGGCGAFSGGGRVVQLKQPATVNFLPLAEACDATSAENDGAGAGGAKRKFPLLHEVGGRSKWR